MIVSKRKRRAASKPKAQIEEIRDEEVLNNDNPTRDKKTALNVSFYYSHQITVKNSKFIITKITSMFKLFSY